METRRWYVEDGDDERTFHDLENSETPKFSPDLRAILPQIKRYANQIAVTRFEIYGTLWDVCQCFYPN